jgi:diguanylate cyclase (GGDEF)-like protein
MIERKVALKTMSQEEISSDLIKLSLLRLIKNKRQGEYKWNLLGGLARGQSSLETSLGVTFDPETKYRASVCFDELRRDGYILPFENLNTNPDDWVKITENGLKALEAGRVDIHPTDDVASSDLSDYGIPNLRAFRKDVSKLVDDEIVSCLFMDLDNFKAVNDTHNHSVGDDVIRAAIDIAKSAVRGKGKLFHRSGDEFLILLPNFDATEACAVAERIRRMVEEHDFPVIGQGFVTATVGVSSSPAFCTLGELDTSADIAAMGAKRLGKNQVIHSGIGKVTATPNDKADDEPLFSDLDETELDLLSTIARLRSGAITNLIIEECPTLAPERVEYHLKVLEDKGYVEVVGVDYRKRGMIYRPTQKGRKMLIKNELI